MIKKRALIWASLLLAFLCALLITRTRRSHDEPTAQPALSVDARIIPATPAAPAVKMPPASGAMPAIKAPSAPAKDRPPAVRIPVNKPLPEIFPHQAEREAIQELTSTYDPEVIPKIAAYLAHPDETVRLAALQGLIQIGHPEAIPHLQSVIPKASAEEAETIREAIDFLRLPTATAKR